MRVNRFYLALMAALASAPLLGNAAEEISFIDQYAVEDLEHMVIGERYQIPHNGKLYHGTYIGIEEINGEKIHVWTDPVEVSGTGAVSKTSVTPVGDAQASANGAATPGTHGGGSRHDDGDNGGAAIAAGVGTLITRGLILTPKLQRELSAAIAELDAAKAATAAAQELLDPMALR